MLEIQPGGQQWLPPEVEWRRECSRQETEGVPIAGLNAATSSKV